jgi:hypothetical protein
MAGTNLAIAGNSRDLGMKEANPMRTTESKSLYCMSNTCNYLLLLACWRLGMLGRASKRKKEGGRGRKGEE